MYDHDQSRPPEPAWIPLSASAAFLLQHKSLLGWSALLVLVTTILTWLGFLLTTNVFDHLTSAYFAVAPATESIWGWIKYIGWITSKYLFLLVSRIVAFFLAFLVAYSLSTPFYAFLSSGAEKIFCGEHFETDELFSLTTILRDLFEGVKIALFGILVSVVALPVGFIPVIGQLGVFAIFTYYSALMFIDYPASRRHWSLGRKLGWLRRHNAPSIRLGIIPAALSMIPLLNIFLIALLFPLLTIHATLNFTSIELPPRPGSQPAHPGQTPP
jgi:CysZ protein